MLPSLKTIEEQDLVLLPDLPQMNKVLKKYMQLSDSLLFLPSPPFLVISSLMDPDRVTKPVPHFFFFSRVCMICFPTFWTGSLVPQSVKNNITCPGLSRLKILPSAR